MGKIIPASDLFGALAVVDEHRIEVLELVNIPQWLFIMQDGLVLSTRYECCHHLGFRSATVHVDYGGVVVHYFK